MTLLKDLENKTRINFYNNFSASTLKVLIVVWAILVIILVLFFLHNKWLLAGVLAYEILP